MRGTDEIDLASDPPPDLGVEVEISRSSRARMPAYAALGVPEIWRYTQKKVEIYLRSAAGQYDLGKPS